MVKQGTDAYDRRAKQCNAKTTPPPPQKNKQQQINKQNKQETIS
jgi:hypothetical protein